MKKIIAVEEKLVIRYVGIASSQNQYIAGIHRSQFIRIIVLNLNYMKLIHVCSLSIFHISR